jgi:hypothetical protein
LSSGGPFRNDLDPERICALMFVDLNPRTRNPYLPCVVDDLRRVPTAGRIEWPDTVIHAEDLVRSSEQVASPTAHALACLRLPNTGEALGRAMMSWKDDM